jgi:hypothetical protein
MAPSITQNIEDINKIVTSAKQQQQLDSFPMKWSHIAIITSSLLTANAFISQSAATRTTTRLNAAMATELRSQLLSLLSNPEGHKDPEVRSKFSSLLDDYSKADGADANDVLFAIGSTVFGAEAAPPAKKAKSSSSEPSLPILDFDYMSTFMKEVFLSYGVTPERAEICADVLIESDKRGIDSHGLGRLKPIYCDRMDDGILWADRPIEVVRESDTTALVGEMFFSLGLTVCVGDFI